MSSIGPADPRDIFTDNERWGDLKDWNSSAVALREEDGIHRIERDGFTPFWAVIDRTALLDIRRWTSQLQTSRTAQGVPDGWACRGAG
jgi:hypothetical protein